MQMVTGLPREPGIVRANQWKQKVADSASLDEWEAHYYKNTELGKTQESCSALFFQRTYLKIYRLKVFFLSLKTSRGKKQQHSTIRTYFTNLRYLKSLFSENPS